MSKYLTKGQVVAEFNNDFSDLFKGQSDESLEFLWVENLELLCKNKRISDKQKNIWIFDKKLLRI